MFIMQRNTRQKTHQQSKLHWGSEEGGGWMLGLHMLDEWRIGWEREEGGGGRDIRVTAHRTGRGVI